MTKIFLIRHAEAEGNIYRRAHGHYNGLVTINGYKQIKLLRERFINEQIGAVHSSDLTRAVATATAISEPRGMQIVTTRALREVGLGSWEDRTWGDIEYNDREMNIHFNDNPAKWQVKGSERYEDVENRVYSYIKKISKQHDGESIAEVSHGFAIRALLCRLRGVTFCETDKVPPYCDNTAISLLLYEKGGFTIEYMGDNSHLNGGHSTLERQSWWREETWRMPENLRFLPLCDVASDSLLRNFKAKAGERALVNTQYVAFLSDEPVGILGLDTNRDAGKKFGWISYVHVAEQHRRKNYGTQLIGLAVSDFRKLRREKLRIELPPGIGGIDFLGKCGFSVLFATDKSCQMEKSIKNW